MALTRPKVVELINVHKVTGDKDAIMFLKNSEKDFTEGLFYQAKHTGQAHFYYRDKKYDVLRSRDFSFQVDESPDQEFSSEQFS